MNGQEANRRLLVMVLVSSALVSCHKEAAPRNPVARFAEPRAQIEFLLVQPGEFMTTLPPKGKEEQTSPRFFKEVTIDGKTMKEEYVFLGKQTVETAFYMSAREVTNEQFSAFCRSTGYSPKSRPPKDAMDMPFLAHLNNQSYKAFAGPQQPVMCVNVSDVEAFCNWLGEDTEYKYRLPSGQEWEYVAYTASTDPFSLGELDNDYLDYAWIRANSMGVTHDVGTKRCNKWGFYDCLGNVYEWTTTLSVLYEDEGPTLRRLECLMVRGGQYNSNILLPTDTAYERPPETRTFGVGFRLVATAR